MKKSKVNIFALPVLIMCIALCFAVFGCSDNGTGTYFPVAAEMKQNLDSKNYSVSVDELDGNYSGTHLIAENVSGEYIEFYWLDEPEFVEHFYELLKNKYVRCDHLVSFEGDKKYGNIVYCGTETAVNDAGIVIVEVKV